MSNEEIEALAEVLADNADYTWRQQAGHILTSSWLAAHDERVRAESLAPVREVHRRIVTNGAYCAHDQQGWPCQTIATLPPERLAGEAGAE